MIIPSTSAFHFLKFKNTSFSYNCLCGLICQTHRGTTSLTLTYPFWNYYYGIISTYNKALTIQVSINYILAIKLPVAGGMAD